MTLGPRSSRLSTPTRRVLADEVVDAIRTAIVTGVIEAGKRLIEGELAAQLQVSRSPVREALVRLELEGLVVTERHRGSTVAEFCAADVGELYSLRTALERLGAEWACRCASDKDLAAVGQVFDDFNELPRPLTPRAVANLDVDFHDAIFSAAASRSAISRLDGVPVAGLAVPSSGRAFRSEYSTTWREDHQELLEALWRMEKTISTAWLSHEAWTGRWTSRRLGHSPSKRSMAAWPRWLLPLSTTQNTRRADA